MAHYNTINIDEIKPHFMYKNYGAYCGEIINISKIKILKGVISNAGYRHTTIRHEGYTIHYDYHRFVYECHHGIIPIGYVVDHIDNNKLNNDINNLQIITPSQNNKKNHMRKSTVARPIRSICIETLFIQDFISMTLAGYVLDINRRSIKFVCDGITNTATSKSNGHRYYFHYL